MIRHCFMCGEQRSEELFPITYKDAVIAHPAAITVMSFELPEQFICSEECNTLFRESALDIITHPEWRTIEALRDWLDEYATHGGDCLFPEEYVLERYPDLHGAVICAGTRAWERLPEDVQDNWQGYHEEYEMLVRKMIEDLS